MADIKEGPAVILKPADQLAIAGHLTPEKQQEIRDAADAAKVERNNQIGNLKKALDEAYWREMCETVCSPPVNQLGRLDHEFAEQLHGVWVYTDSTKTLVDWKRTYYTRKEFQEGYQKLLEQGRLAKVKAQAKMGKGEVVPDDVIAQLIDTRINRQENAAPIRNNRFVHSEKR